MSQPLYTFTADALSDPVEVVRFQGVEEISRLFRFEITIATGNQSLPFDDLVGTPGQLTLQVGEEPRHVHGIILALAQHQVGKKLNYYQITLVPELWKAHKKQSFRIFQDKSTADIIELVLNDLGLSAGDFRMALQGNYSPREYCVQYRESDWDFLSRLMEEDGIFCFFEHADGGHTLVVADSTSAYGPIAGDSSLRFHPPARVLAQTEHVSQFRFRQAVRPDKVTLRDYNFKKPSLNLEKDAEGGAKAGIEVYDYPGDYFEPADGSNLASLQVEQWQVAAKLGTGDSSCVRLIPGHTFSLIEHPRGDFNAGYLFVRVEHRGAQPGMGEDTDTEEENYANRFLCVPEGVPYRPPHRTPKPKIHGIQTAVVTGPSGEEIHTDEHGRIKVQFHWDREGKKDEKSSCWIRVRQMWSGPGWGGLFIPRIGQEVVVEFLEGDPDRPLVAGTVYHGANVPPYVLPDEKTKSTIKSNSTIGGDGFNELRFEDKKDKEEVYLHGQKDWTIRIENDKNQEVGHDETLDVGNDRTKTVGHDQSETVKHNKKITVGDNHTEGIGGNQAISVSGKQTLDVSKDRSVSVGGKHTESVSKDQSTSIGGAFTQTIAKDMSVKVDKNQAVAVKEAAQLTVDKDRQVIIKGDAKEDVAKEKTIVVGKKLIIECGKGKVVIEKDGKIGIEGKDISIKGKGDIKIEGKKLEVKSKGGIKVKASGDVKVKGSKVGIN